MSRRRILLIAGVVLVILVVARLQQREQPAPPSDVADPAFYVAPDPFPPGQPGDILRIDEVDGLGQPGTLLRVLYRSESLAGQPIAVSGVISIPPGEPPAGGWPVLSIAHGTVGLADRCAPSRTLVAQAPTADSTSYVVVATDYEGLGTAGRHPYLVGESEARGVIDGVRAARNLGDRAKASDRYAVIGYSQGGQAALFANEIASTWAPELTLVGTVAGAPVVELADWVGGLESPTWDWLKAMVVAGFQAADPAADPAKVLTSEGRVRFPVVDDGCLAEITSAFTGSRDALRGDLRRTPPFDRLLAANTAGQRKGASPVLLVGGDADELIRPPLLDRAFARLCGVGQSVDRRTYPGLDHAQILPGSFGDAVAWSAERFAGTPAKDTCP